MRDIRNPIKYLVVLLQILIVSFTQAVVHEGAVVVKHLNAIAAVLAVGHPLQFNDLAC
jgi:hypothetical protein